MVTERLRASERSVHIDWQHAVVAVQQRQGTFGSSNSQVWPRAGVRMDGMFDGRTQRFGNGFSDDTTFSVPAEKCGLVIGKGASLGRSL